MGKFVGIIYSPATPPPPAAADYPEAIHIQREDSSKVRNTVRCGVNFVKRNQGD
jgi:hypothetical protein